MILGENRERKLKVGVKHGSNTNRCPIGERDRQRERERERERERQRERMRYKGREKKGRKEREKERDSACMVQALIGVQ